ncbi:MAG: sulfatase-like hydrolase/transferase, partial [Caldilineaceae bacterium SB0664_bin_22]|nr:sulfatase-like hydrolase/transferase [Caldilineaceae bacterium SB0664_bin_22]
GPHPPYDPTPEDVQPYLEKDLPITPVSQADLDNQPPPFKVMRRHNTEVDHDSVVHIEDPPVELRHRQRAYYLANVSMIDRQVGNILAALERNGYLDNAVVIFTSDHGDCLGDHGHSQKWTMYEQIVRVPLLIWAPGRIAPGHAVDGLCQQMDLGPAILEWAGLEPDPGMEAVSLAPALSGGPWAGRDHVYAEHGRDGILQETEFMTMVRNRRWKLVHFAGEEFGQLFDLANDPLEEHCLWHDPGAQEVKQLLLDELREWRIHSAVHTKDWFSRWR